MLAEKIVHHPAEPVPEKLLAILDQLSPDLLQEVEDFAQFLFEKRSYQRTGRLNPQLRGVLKELGEEYTSVELQHKSLEWWSDEVPS